MSNVELSSCNEKVNQNMRRLRKGNSLSSSVTQDSRLSFASSMLYLLWEAALSMYTSPSHSHMCPHVTFISASILSPTWESRELAIVCYSHQWCACSSLCCVAAQSCPLCDPLDCSPPGSSVHGISQQDDQSGFPFPHARDLLTPRLNPWLLHLLHWQGDVFTIEPQGKFRSKNLCWQVPKMAMQRLCFPTIYLCETHLSKDEM